MYYLHTDSPVVAIMFIASYFSVKAIMYTAKFWGEKILVNLVHCTRFTKRFLPISRSSYSVHSLYVRTEVRT